MTYQHLPRHSNPKNTARHTADQQYVGAKTGKKRQWHNVLFKKVFLKSALASTLSIATLLGLASPARSEGSAQIGTNQPIFEYGVSFSNTSTGIFSPNHAIYIDITSPGEVINISVCGEDNTDDIRIEIYSTTPNATDPVLVPTTGALLTTENLTDSNVDCGDPMTGNLTTPFQFTTPTTGTFEVRFFNDTGTNNLLDRIDVTVTSDASDPVDPTAAQGRIYSYSWAFDADGFEVQHSADTDYFVKVPGGRFGENFVWRLDLNNFAGFVYEIVANNLGVDPPFQGLSVNFVEGGITNSITPLFPMYLSHPAVVGTRPTLPPEVINFRFTDSAGVDNSISPGTTGGVQDSGTFSFNTDVDGTFVIVIDADQDGQYAPGDTFLFGEASPGANSIVWDGTDNEGNVLPDGTYSAQLQVRLGEFHFVASDAETSGGLTDPGLTVFESLGSGISADTLVFWDDFTILGATTTLPTGELSSSPAARHTWGDNNTNGTGFGNRRFIDTYVYGDSTTTTSAAIIGPADTPIERDYGDAPDTGAGGTDNTNYETTEANGGPNHIITAGLQIGTAPDADDGTQQNTAADEDDATASDEGDITLPELLTSTTTYTVSNIAVTNTTGNDAFLTGWIDFDQSGTFDSDEQATATISNGQTTADLEWSATATNPIPADITAGTSYARFRLSSTDGLEAVGSAIDGEVEDYQLDIVFNQPLGSPFTCDSTFYITIGPGGGTNQQLYSVDRTGTSFNFNTIGPATTIAGGYPNNFDYNALAYNPVDNYIYGYINNSGATSGPYGPGNVIQIGSDGIAQSLGIPVTSAPNGNTALSGNFVAGAILSDETYVIGRQGIFATLDISTTPPTIINSQASVSGVRLNDFAVDPRDPASITNGKVFAVNENGSQDRLIVLDIRNFPPTIDSQAPNVTGFAQNAGSQFVDAFGTLFFRSGAGIDALYEVDSDPSSPTYGVATQVATTPTGGNHDGVSCLFATAMQKTVTDTDDNPITTIPAGEVVRYVYRIATGNVLDLTGVTFEDDLRSVASGPPINGTFTGDFTVSNGSGTVSFSNSNQTLQISNLTLPAQDPVMPDGEVLIITADVLVSDTLTVDTYFNQSFLTTLPAQYPASIPSDYPPSASYEDPTPLDVTAPLPTDPNVILVKRITAINRGLTGEQLFDSSYIDVGSTTDNDNEVNWPGAPIAENFGGGAGTVERYITGVSGIDDVTAVTGVTVNPGDVLEYTIPFLSNGAVPAQDVFICDRIPTNTTFDPTAFNGSTPAPGDHGIFISFNSNNVALTNDNDGDEIADTGGNDNGIGGYYFPPTVDPSVELGTTINCNGSNDNGVIVVDLSDIPNATGDGTPTDAYGFIRFRAIVN